MGISSRLIEVSPLLPDAHVEPPLAGFAVNMKAVLALMVWLYPCLFIENASSSMMERNLDCSSGGKY